MADHNISGTLSKSSFLFMSFVWVSFASFANVSVCRLHSDTISDGNYLLAIAYVAYCSSDSVCLRCKDRIICVSLFHQCIVCVHYRLSLHKGQTILVNLSFRYLVVFKAGYLQVLYCTLTQIFNRFPCQSSLLRSFCQHLRYEDWIMSYTICSLTESDGD